ncbi:hypothetical protein AB1L42_20935 [Thalassoglobus sp. JC818]|uniref:hypothetical protein n=1 Tax=Thalassoglobus sp. JC818 TaxID=3232136 RepID=UPI0034589293
MERRDEYQETFINNMDAEGTLKVQIGIVGAVVVVACLVYWLMQPARLTDAAFEQFKAKHARPELSEKDESVQSFTLNGLELSDASHTYPTNHEHVFRVVLNEQPATEHPVFRYVAVVPRQATATEEDFQLIDGVAESWISVQPPKTDRFSLELTSRPTKFRLQPGEYRVRYFLQTDVMDLENEPLPETVALGEGFITIVASEEPDQRELHVPLADDHPVLREDASPR